MTKDMTTGSPFRCIINFAVPVFLGMLFQQLYNMVDTMIVGRFLGLNALAGVGSTGSLYFLVIGFMSYCFLLIYCKGTLRLYVFLGEVLGFIIARLSVSKLFLTLLKFIKSSSDYIYNLIKKPIRFLKEKFIQFLLKPITKKLQNIIMKTQKRKLSKKTIKKTKKVQKSLETS